MGKTERQVIGGVDTHQDVHVAAAIDELGRVIGSQSFPTTARGYEGLLRWLRRQGTIVAVGVEGTGSWGAGLSRHLQAAGIRTLEVNRPNRQLRRQRGKSDPVDAEAAARAVLAGQARVVPKAADGQVECMRLLRVARRGAIKARTQAMGQLRNVLATAPDDLRARFRDLPTAELIERASRLRTGPPGDPEAAAKLVLASLARRWLALNAEAKALSVELRYLVAAISPSLIARPGVGVDSASALLVVAGDNPARLRSDAAFAAVCGTSPVEASSGKVVRHRLNRGGNREANSALWRIVLVRLRSDPRTRAYLARRTAEGRSTREVMRCLKRYVAREVYAAIQRDLGVGKVRTDNGDDSSDQRGQPNPDGRLFGEVTSGPEGQDTPRVPKSAESSLLVHRS